MGMGGHGKQNWLSYFSQSIVIATLGFSWQAQKLIRKAAREQNKGGDDDEDPDQKEEISDEETARGRGRGRGKGKGRGRGRKPSAMKRPASRKDPIEG